MCRLCFWWKPDPRPNDDGVCLFHMSSLWNIQAFERTETIDGWSYKIEGRDTNQVFWKAAGESGWKGSRYMRASAKEESSLRSGSYKLCWGWPDRWSHKRVWEAKERKQVESKRCSRCAALQEKKKAKDAASLQKKKKSLEHWKYCLRFAEKGYKHPYKNLFCGAAKSRTFYVENMSHCHPNCVFINFPCRAATSLGSNLASVTDLKKNSNSTQFMLWFQWL